MTRLAKIAGPLAVAAALCFRVGSGQGPVWRMDESQMEQFAPMLEMMKQKMGKQNFARLMQTMGPMMDADAGPGRRRRLRRRRLQQLGTEMGGGGFDMGQMMAHDGLDEGPHGWWRPQGKRRHRG